MTWRLGLATPAELYYTSPLFGYRGRPKRTMKATTTGSGDARDRGLLLTVFVQSLRAVPESLWTNRWLIRRLVMREIAARYRGSILGIGWALLTPVVLLAVYTFVFSVVFQARWQLDLGGKGNFALTLFCGLIVYQIFAECIGRAPNQLLENRAYIKKLIFPLETLAWVSIGTALFNMLLSLVVLLFAHLVIAGVPPLTSLLLPLILLPYVMILVGLIWLLSATGVYLRDLGQLVAVILPVLLFASAVFFPLSAVPQPYQTLVSLNPLVYVIEATRGIMLFGVLPSLLSYLFFVFGAAMVAWLGMVWFKLLRRGFADVV